MPRFVSYYLNGEVQNRENLSVVVEQCQFIAYGVTTKGKNIIRENESGVVL